jgi:hypothetical protein
MKPFIRLILAITTGVFLAACSPDESTADSTKGQKQTAAPNQVERVGIPIFPFPKLEASIVPTLGQALSQSVLNELKASTALVPDLQNRITTSEKILIARGNGGSEVISVAFRLNGNQLLAIDYTLSTSKDQAQERQRKLLADYKMTGSHTISQLSPSLDTIEVPVSDYRHHTDQRLRAATFEVGGVVRVVLFDATQVNAESLIPAVNSLPPDLLETAKRALKAQRALHDEKEAK